jgi:RND family efflux transporter MFP subunit
MKKVIIILLLIGVAGLLGWQIYEKATASLESGGRRRRQPVVAVETAPVMKKSIVEVGNFTGTLYPQSIYSLAPKISGRVEKILVNLGDSVQEGQLVALLDSAEHQENLLQAKAELEVAKANLLERQNLLENAQRELGRTRELRKTKIASVSQLDAAQSEVNTQKAKLRVAQAQVSQKTAALKMAQLRLSYTRIEVPMHGGGQLRVVGERFVDQGALLSSNQPIISVLEVDKLIAAIHVIERDYPKIQIGLEAQITTDAFPGRTFGGKVIRIAPLLKEKSREAKVEVQVPNADMLLKPGMFARVRIKFAQHDNATVVPKAALLKRNGMQGVYLADLNKMRAKFVTVKVGIVNGAHAEILDPPLKGQIITLGQHLLSDGGKIMIPAKEGGRPASAAGKAWRNNKKARPGEGKPSRGTRKEQKKEG